MRTAVKVARFHLMDRTLVWMPIGVLVFVFLVNLVIFAVVPRSDGGGHTYAISTLYIWLMIVGIVMIVQRLPFGLTLGLSRRAFYRGTALLVLAMAAVYAVGVTAAQAIERAGDGWGVQMHFFRVPWLFDAPWYETLVTAFVLGAAVMVYGAWYGVVFRRWGIVGMVAFVAAQLLVLTFGALATTWADAWGDVGSFFTTINAIGFAGVLAAATVVLGLGGYTTLRRVAV
jgi:hypothetical protein